MDNFRRENDPTFDILEETRSGFSNLKIKNKKMIRVDSDEDMDTVIDFDEVEIVEPELDEKDKKSFETVQKIIQDGHLVKLKVEQCKVYLRKYGLRLTGNKDTLIQRIKEHLEVLDGGGEKKYPVSSFVLNCKGDACTGDIVLFEQNVYDMFNIASRSASGPPRGTRIVAGRIIKENYGAAKQQHTFTIEVLWSKGEKPHPPLHPLLIKGRNLYRLKTLRQRWENEGQRQKALMEKHSRGDLARNDRETRMQEKELRKNIKTARMLTKKEPNKIKSHEELNTNQNQMNLGFSNYLGNPIVQAQQGRPIQTYPGYIPPLKSNPVMMSNQNSNTLKENIVLPPTSTKPFSLRSAETSDTRNIQHQRTEFHRNYCQPMTNMNHYPPSIIMNHYPPSTSTYPCPPLRPRRAPKQVQMQLQLCHHFAKGRCYYGDNCKFLHETRP